MLRIKLDDIEPVTWGVNDSLKRNKIRQAIKSVIPEFNEQYIEGLLKNYTEISIILNCFLKKPFTKDIDNLSKIPIDAIFFSAKDDSGKYEIGHTNNWESKITSLTIHKIKSGKNILEIIIDGM